MILATAEFEPANASAVVASRFAPQVVKAVERSTALVLAAAQAKVPVGRDRFAFGPVPGDLRDSGHTFQKNEAGQSLGTVLFDHYEAQFVEFGTGLAGRGTYPGTLPTSGVPITGAWIYDYRGKGWPGDQASPYLRPALDENEQAIVSEFQKIR